MSPEDNVPVDPNPLKQKQSRYKGLLSYSGSGKNSIFSIFSVNKKQWACL